MKQPSPQRLKLLFVYRILLDETDEEHPLTVYQLAEKLGALGITCDRRTLSRDMRLLNDNGIEVMTTRVGHSLGYYIDDRDFSVSELKILVDAVQAANFITPAKSGELIKKLSRLGGVNKEETIRSNGVLFNSRKHKNETIYATVSQLAEAIRQGRRVMIKSFYLAPDGSRRYRHGGELYTIFPLRLCYVEDNYYVICYDRKAGLVSRRVDKIELVQLSDKKLTRSAAAQQEKVSRYSGGVFKMFTGSSERVTLEFGAALADQLFDRFGESLVITPAPVDGLFNAEVEVEISPTFWGWLFTYAGELRVTAPESVKAEYRARLTAALEE